MTLIHDMTPNKKLKTHEMVNVAGCSERSIKAIRSNFHYFGTTKAPPNGGGRPPLANVGMTTHTFVLLSNAFESLARSAKATKDYVLHVTVPVTFAWPRFGSTFYITIFRSGRALSKLLYYIYNM
jgi:hypothetical protein